jgi:hypothetical protein
MREAARTQIVERRCRQCLRLRKDPQAIDRAAKAADQPRADVKGRSQRKLLLGDGNYRHFERRGGGQRLQTFKRHTDRPEHRVGCGDAVERSDIEIAGNEPFHGFT